MTTTMMSKITRTIAGFGAAAILAAASPATAADPTDSMIRTAVTLSEEYDLPAGLLLAIAQTESDFDANCRTGACVGLMQINSKYVAEYAKAAGMESWDLLDPDDSMRIAASMMAGYLDRYEGDLHYALMCYNLGEYGALAKRRNGCSSTGYSRKVIGCIEKWADAEVDHSADAGKMVGETTDDSTRANTALERFRLVITGVMQRAWEVIQK